MSAVLKKFEEIKKRAEEFILERYPKGCVIIQVGSATCEEAAGSDVIYEEFKKHIKASGEKNILIKRVGCTGRCSLEPIVSVFVPGKKLEVYKSVDVKLAGEIFMSHIMKGVILEEHLIDKECEILQRSQPQKQLEKQAITHKFFEVYADIPFYCMQTRIALRNSGLIDPLSIYEYIKYGGFSSVAKILDRNNPKEIVNEVVDSKLRGRGGAGFPTGKKWAYITEKSE
ncbi:MAG: Protein HymB, partial [uncultured bacterium]